MIHHDLVSFLLPYEWALPISVPPLVVWKCNPPDWESYLWDIWLRSHEVRAFSFMPSLYIRLCPVVQLRLVLRWASWKHFKIWDHLHVIAGVAENISYPISATFSECVVHRYAHLAAYRIDAGFDCCWPTISTSPTAFITFALMWFLLSLTVLTM